MRSALPLRTLARVAASIAVLTGAPTGVPAQDFAEVVVRAERVAPGLHVLFGRGGNVAVLTGPDGPVVIDDQYAPLHPKLREAIRGLDPARPDAPVRFVINTHWHGDHTGGNEAFGRAGALLVAHDEVRARMATAQTNPFLGRETPASPAGALPVLTFSHATTLHWNDERIHVEHVPHAHTDGDALVWFEKARAVHVGDVFFNGTYPFIDVASGGSIDGVIAAAAAVLERIDAETVVIPGHGPVATRADLERYHAMLVEVRRRARAAVDSGQMRDAWIASAPLADLEPVWGGGFIRGEQLLALVWASLGGATGPAQ